jgi:C-terminal processing protease CtpA/Prc
LIIDLRNNPGGHNSFSDYMLSYVADTSFRFSNKFLVRTSELTKSFWKEINDSSLLELKNDILTNENGTSFENTIPYNKPRITSLSFKGNVYVLINRFDFSQAVNAAAVVQDYKFGILIGEKTADHSSLLASAQYFTLPNTGLTVQYPKAFIVRPNGDEKAEEVIPDYKISDDIFTDKDEILEFAIELINND